MSDTHQGHQFGTFKGVFTPSILTILGVIMYLRLPWVLGSVGLLPTLLIVTMSVTITLLTAFSISAMATNMKVGGGGAYYMISRTLGLDVGVAVGLPLFMAQALGIAFYIVGFSDTVVTYFPFLSSTLVGVVTLVLMTALAYASADLALRTQFIILGILALSLISLFLGAAPTDSLARGVPLPAAPFWITFAVFFPAVTGIEAGLGMSGDLKNPARSLPIGTLLAVVTGFAVYLAIPWFISAVGTEREVLLGDSMVITRIARWPILVLLGILGASLSSAMGALLSAPRTLQALAHDSVLPRIVGKGFGPNNDPRIATVVAFAVGLAGILMGNLDSIASVLSMFFLMSYAALNLSAGLEGVIAGPAWRPEFRVPPWVSLAGAAACTGAMLMIDAGATITAGLVIALLHYIVQRRKLGAQWGDVRYGLLVAVAGAAIYALARRTPNARSWNPNLLVLAGPPKSRWHLIVLAQAFAGRGGLMTIATVLPSDGEDTAERLDAVKASVERHLEESRVRALVKVEMDDSVTAGLTSLVKSYGFGPLVPNTVLVGQAANTEDPVAHAELLATIQREQKNLIVVHEGEDLPVMKKARRIDIWWRGHRGNLGLRLALASLLRNDPAWHDAEVMVWRVVSDETGQDPAIAEIKDLLTRGRIPATVHTVVHVGDAFEAIRKHSRGADMVFLGLRPRLEDETIDAYAQYYAHLCRATDGLPPTVLVTAGNKVDLHGLFDE